MDVTYDDNYSTRDLREQNQRRKSDETNLKE